MPLSHAELLLPAGSLTKLKTAVLYGADAVYAGTPDMCLRAQSKMTMDLSLIHISEPTRP